jgi:hypothetical protein
VELDPGTYEFRFETPGFDPITATHVAHVGDTNRLIEVVFGEAPPSAPGSDGRMAPMRREREVPTMSYVLGGVGVLALGAFAYLRFDGIQQYNELNADCSPNCDDAKVEELETQFQLAYVPLGVGAAALAGAGVIYFMSAPVEPETETQLSIVPNRGGAGALLRTRF